MTDSQVIDLAIDSFFNEPYNQPSRTELAKRHDLTDEEVRRAVGDDNWVLIRRMIFEEAVRLRLKGRQVDADRIARGDAPADEAPPSGPLPDEKPTARARTKKETDGA